jgi:hypothetical protein
VAGESNVDGENTWISGRPCSGSAGVALPIATQKTQHIASHVVARAIRASLRAHLRAIPNGIRRSSACVREHYSVTADVREFVAAARVFVIADPHESVHLQ